MGQPAAPRRAAREPARRGATVAPPSDRRPSIECPPARGEPEQEGLAFFRGLLVALLLSALCYGLVAVVVLAALKLPR